MKKFTIIFIYIYSSTFISSLYWKKYITIDTNVHITAAVTVILINTFTINSNIGNETSLTNAKYELVVNNIFQVLLVEYL